jgi:hypothetical protein
MAKKKETNTMSPRNAEPTLPIMERLHQGNWVKGPCNCTTHNLLQLDDLCKNWNGSHNQPEQACPVPEADYLSCPFLVKTKRRNPLI